MRKLSAATILVSLCAHLTPVAATRIPAVAPHVNDPQRPLLETARTATFRNSSEALQDVLDALEAMQETYFDKFAGTWGDAIDWTAAVAGTHVSATLTGIVDGLDLSFGGVCSDLLQWENVVNQYYTQTAFFYFGENVFALRNQAFDDMLWVVLGWLESTKFADMYARRHENGQEFETSPWHGLQLSPMAAHRARVFYELASVGWDESLCNGGMTWNPSLNPYKNAITNELFAAASISMYLYFPGDNNSAPFISSTQEQYHKVHNPAHLENAVKSYKWLKESGMRNQAGLYQDGFHVTGWHRFPNGTINPGTGHCDDLDRMVYTYNQGVMLTASRGLWLATGARSYLDDGHELITNVIRATGWPNTDNIWRGLGRGGTLEEFCDHGLYCSQDGQTFKGIFFLHLAEFCRPLRASEKDMAFRLVVGGLDDQIYHYHLERCAAYSKWIYHNADAALATKNQAGLFGMWWNVPYQTAHIAEWESLAGNQSLPAGVFDHRNPALISSSLISSGDPNDRGRGRTVETQSGALAVLRAKWQWQAVYS
ncbi:hypothetical protein LTS08_006977 [Lithohypha guttulata]|nr:hypothetical protein LTS08_006977 [Lithohypha guttulata]